MGGAVTWALNSLTELFLGWMQAFANLIRECARRRERRDEFLRRRQVKTKCAIVPSDVYKRPDPLIYSQHYLASLGLAVTWDNPDIQLFEADTLKPVNSSDLQPDSEYEIHATIYNGSNEAPAIGLAVEFSYLSFGIGTVSHPIGATNVDLHVNGSPQHPALARMRWRTPAIPGHYCLQVKIGWGDDANPDNNLGQENTNVGIAHSPALFRFEARNDTRLEQIVAFHADRYAIPPLSSCDELPADGREDERRARDQRTRRSAERERRVAWAADRHSPRRHGLPEGWRVAIEPPEAHLAAGEAMEVRVAVEPPDGWTGKQPINIAGRRSDGSLIGGVTLYVHRQWEG